MKNLAAIGLLIAGVIGLGMSLCGGVVTVGFLSSIYGDLTVRNIIPALLSSAFPIACVVIGLIVTRRVYVRIKEILLSDGDED